MQCICNLILLTLVESLQEIDLKSRNILGMPWDFYERFSLQLFCTVLFVSNLYII